MNIPQWFPFSIGIGMAILAAIIALVLHQFKDIIKWLWTKMNSRD